MSEKQSLVLTDEHGRKSMIQQSSRLIEGRDIQGKTNRQLFVNRYERNERQRRRRLSAKQKAIIYAVGNMSKRCPFTIRGFRVDDTLRGGDWNPWRRRFVSYSKVRNMVKDYDQLFRDWKEKPVLSQARVNSATSSFSRSVHRLMKRGPLFGLAMKWFSIEYTMVDIAAKKMRAGWVASASFWAALRFSPYLSPLTDGISTCIGG